MPERPSADAFWGWASLAVLVLAVVLRIGGLVSFESMALSRWPQVDAWTYWDQAQALFKGKDPFEEGFYQPPGYPWILSWLFAVTGKASLTTIRVFQAFLGIFSTWAVLWLGNRLGRRVGREWLGPLSAFVFTLYPSTLLFELDILTPAVTTAFLLGALLCLWTGDRPAPWRAALAGALLGACAMVHATYLLVVPAWAVALWAWRGSDGKRALGGGTVVAGLLLGAALGVSPTAVTNLTRWHQVSLVSENAGINLYLGNNPDWKTTAFLKPGLPFRKLVLEAEPDKRDQFQRDSFWQERTLAHISQDPGAFLGALATKLLWSFNNREIPRNEDYACRTREGATRWIGWLPVRYGLMLPFAAVGAVLLARRRNEGWLALGAWMSLHAVLVIFLVTDRYRVATWPVVSLAAGWGLGEAGRWLKGLAGGARPHARQALLWGVPVGLGLVLPWLPLDEVARFHESWCTHLKGNVAVSEQEPEEAVKWYVRTLELDPTDMGARQFLAETWLKQKKYDDAIAVMEPLIQAFPDSYPALILMTDIYERMGEPGVAAEYCERAWKVPGPRTNTGIRYLRLLVKAGHVQVAREVAASSPELAAHPKVKELLAGL